MAIDLHGGSYLPKKITCTLYHRPSEKFFIFSIFFHSFSFCLQKTFIINITEQKLHFSTDFSRKHWSNKSFISAKKVPLHYFIIHQKILHIFKLFSFLIFFVYKKTFKLRITKQNYIFHRILFSEHWSNKSFHYPFCSLSSKLFKKFK